MTVGALLADSPLLLQASCLLLGLLVGSFLNVVAHRLPLMLERQWQREAAQLQGQEPAALARYDLIQPRSACPACQAPIAARHNIPVLGWLWLKGRCHQCKAPISVRYPLVELFTGLASAAVAWRFGYDMATVLALLFTWALIALSCIDLDTHLLPDDITLPLLWLGLASAAWLPTALPGALPVDLSSAVIGAIVGYLSLWSVYHLFRLITGKEGMGHGDFKLLAALGAWLGWQMLVPIILMSAGVGALVGITLILLGRQQRDTPLPFGPFLAAAGWLMLLCGHELVDRYLALYPSH
jgi:leader peptidase (prepilin peptidase)/N-methyltransferase